MTTDLDAVTLGIGAHDTPKQGLCVMEAAALMAGERHSDHPLCVSPVIAAFLRSWNDTLDDTTRQSLKRHIPNIVGTNTGLGDDKTRAWMAADWLVRTFTPAWLRAAGLHEQADLLAGLTPLSADTSPGVMPTLEAVKADAIASRAAARDADWNAVLSEAWIGTQAVAWAAAWSASRCLVQDVGWSAVRDVAWSTAREAAWSSAQDALQPTVVEVQTSGHGLVSRMCEVGRTGAVA